MAIMTPIRFLFFFHFFFSPSLSTALSPLSHLDFIRTPEKKSLSVPYPNWAPLLCFSYTFFFLTRLSEHAVLFNS